MEIKGLCSTCVELKTCIFVKEPPVWQCEEFSNGKSAVAASHKQPKAKGTLLCEETTAE